MTTKVQSALEVALDTLSNIADEGIDMDTFNEGGIGYEAVQAVRLGLEEILKLEVASREALQFIMTLRDSTPNEALDLLTNNGGEDVEAKLATALGVSLEDDPACQCMEPGCPICDEDGELSQKDSGGT